MGRTVRIPLLTLLVFLAISSASATTYYIAANGSDSNNGTSKTTPWLHAPGMQGCSGACASTTTQAGDRFIFRGGDSWHYSAGYPIGLPWIVSRSGASGNTIYIGVDSTWYAGAAWARPILTMDNPLTTSSPSSCTYDDSNNTAVTISGNYVIFDNFEFTGKCWAGSPAAGVAYLRSMGQNIKATNNFLHGWTVATTAGDDNHYMFAGSGSGNTGNEWAYNVVDGSDSTFGAACTTPSCVANTTTKGATGWAFGVECYNVHHNVIRHVSNGLECQNVTIVHDNLLEYLFEPSFGGRHGNNIESLGGNVGLIAYYYNNVTRNTNEGVDWWPQFSTGYIFNNVFENSGHVYGSPAIDPNCLMLSPPGGSNIAVVITAYVYDNTFDGTCGAQASSGNANTPHWASGSTITFSNNHILDRTSIGTFFSCGAPSLCGETDNGGEVFQTTTAANAQGYTLANNFQPANATGATVGAGTNVSNSCATFSSDKALCSGTSGGTSEGAGAIAVYPTISPVQRASAWDAGAYEFGSATKPNPPSGLAATVQ